MESLATFTFASPLEAKSGPPFVPVSTQDPGRGMSVSSGQRMGETSGLGSISGGPKRDTPRHAHALQGEKGLNLVAHNINPSIQGAEVDGSL